MIMLNLNIYKQIFFTFAFFFFASLIKHLFVLFFSFPVAVVSVCVDYIRKSILLSSPHHLLFDIVYVSHFFFFFILLLLCSKVKKRNYWKKNTLVFIFSKKISTFFLILILFLAFISFHFFLYSNPCFSLSRSLFLPYLQTIHLNVRLSLRNRQKNKKLKIHSFIHS